MRIGLTQATASSDSAGLLQRCVALGVGGVEPMIGAADSEYLRWTRADSDAFAAKARELDISIPSLALSMFNYDSSLVERAGYTRSLAVVETSLKVCDALGAGTMMLCTYLASAPDTPAKRKALLRIIRGALPLAQELGVSIALESPLPAHQMTMLLDEAASDFVGVYFDMGNAIALGFDPVEEIELLGHRILGVHVKDSIDRLGALSLGAGRLDVQSALTALDEIGYDDWLMLETPGKNDAAVRDDIKACLSVLVLRLLRGQGAALEGIAADEG